MCYIFGMADSDTLIEILEKCDHIELLLGKFVEFDPDYYGLPMRHLQRLRASVKRAYDRLDRVRSLQAWYEAGKRWEAQHGHAGLSAEE